MCRMMIILCRWDFNEQTEKLVRLLLYTSRTVKEILRCVIPVMCRKTDGGANISHENTNMVVRIYDGV